MLQSPLIFYVERLFGFVLDTGLTFLCTNGPKQSTIDTTFSNPYTSKLWPQSRMNHHQDSKMTWMRPSPPDTSSVKAEVGLDEDDVDEDSLDLNTTNADAKVWLVRLPKFLMEKWKDVSSTSGNDLGKVRIKNGGAEPWQVKLVLNESPENDNIPHEYDIKLVKKVVDNTYVFTEKDLPNYKKRAAMAESGLLSEAAASTSESTPALPPSGFKGRSSFVDRTRNNSDNTRCPIR